MDTAEPYIIIIIAGLALAVTIIGLMVGLGYRFGRLTQNVEGLDQKVDGLSESAETLRMEIATINPNLAALANHRHDENGNTIFVAPPRHPSG